MMRKLSEIITRNFGWKVLSLITAIVIWFLIMNYNDPVDERSFPVLLRVDGESMLKENDYVLLNADELTSTVVNLRVRGSRSSIEDLKKNSGGLYAYIDVAPIDISRSTELGKRLPVRIKYGQSTANYDILYSTPEEAEVVLDKYVTRSIPVTVEKTDEDRAGYISLDPEATPSTVVIGGPSSYINTITEVKASIEVGEATEAFEAVYPISVLTAEGRDISPRLDLSVQEVSVYVAVETYAKIPVSTPLTVGEAANGYRITSVTLWPHMIEVEGNSADIRALSAIRLMDIDVSGISRTKVETYDIRAYLAGTNLSIRQGSEDRVRVTVTVEKEITKEIVVPIDKIDIKGQTTAISLPPGEVRLEVRGIASEIVEFEQSQFVSYVDVTGLEDGIYELEVRLETPDGIVQTAAENIEIIIGDTGAETEAEEE